MGCKSRETVCLSQDFDEDTLAQPSKAINKAAKKQAVILRANPVGRHEKRIQRKHLSINENVAELDGSCAKDRVIEEQHLEIQRALVGLWPCDQELIVLRRLSAEHTFGFLDPFSSSCSEANSGDVLLSRDILQSMPHETHPVLLARRLLHLSVFLQHLPRHSSENVSKLYQKATQIFNKVTALVTTNDELVHSIEGIECVALESMIHNGLGHLRRALLSLRKAMVLAQLMGLHQEDPSVSEVIEPQTRARIDFSLIWFRLVQSDRYLSLMLGVPQVWADNTFLERRSLGFYSPAEQLERLLILIGGRILNRDETDMQKLAVTQEIDHLLQRAATCMPPQWWLCPNSAMKGEDEQSRMRRTMLQLTYFFLLTQLHFPYLLYPSDSHLYAYSKTTAVNASRDILTRFVAFRENSSTIYCRGVDFIAFLASVALCLAHIEGRRAQFMLGGNTQGTLPFSYLTHQRMGDRGLVERTFEYMEKRARDNEDAIASRLAILLRQVLAMESSSASGAILSASFSTRFSSRDPHFNGQVNECGARFSLSIPHCGEVQLEICSDGIEPTVPVDPMFDLGVDTIAFQWRSEAASTEDISELDAWVRRVQEDFAQELVEK